MSYLGRTGKLSQRAYNKISFLATAGQTVKSGLSYVAGFVEVYVNGTLLTDVVDYSASNGNSVTFLVALSIDDEVTVVSLKTFVAANMLPLSGGTLNGDLDVAGSVTVDGNVGIGTNSPGTFDQRVNAPHLVVGSGANASGLTVYSGPTNQASINFATGVTGSQQYDGGLTYAPGGSAHMAFHVSAGSEKMRLDSAGNLLVGKTSNVFGDVGAVIRSPSSLGSLITLTKSGENVAAFNRLASDGSVVTFSKDNTTVGSVKSVSGVTIGIDGGGARSGLQFNANGVDPRYNGVGADNAIDLGRSDNRFKDLHLSGGVVFGDAGGTGTSSSNTLDGYEEGSFTFGISVGNIGGTSKGKYTKVGNQVTVFCQVDSASEYSSTAIVELTGLPFVPITPNNSGHAGNGAISYPAGMGGDVISAIAATGSSTVFFGLSNGSNLQYNMCTGTWHCRFTISYQTN